MPPPRKAAKKASPRALQEQRSDADVLADKDKMWLVINFIGPTGNSYKASAENPIKLPADIPDNLVLALIEGGAVQVREEYSNVAQ